jgi:hypothetical protein
VSHDTYDSAKVNLVHQMKVAANLMGIAVTSASGVVFFRDARAGPFDGPAGDCSNLEMFELSHGI